MRVFGVILKGEDFLIECETLKEEVMEIVEQLEAIELGYLD